MESTVEQERLKGMARLRGLFKSARFTRVKVRQAPLPQHILAELTAADEEEEGEGVDAEKLALVCAYYRVTAAQGNLGIMIDAEGHMLIDFTGTGVPLEKLPGGSDAPPNWALCPLTDEFTLKNVRRLLRRNRHRKRKK